MGNLWLITTMFMVSTIEDFCILKIGGGAAFRIQFFFKAISHTASYTAISDHTFEPPNHSPSTNNHRQPKRRRSFKIRGGLFKQIRGGLLSHPVPSARDPFRRFRGRGNSNATLNREAWRGELRRSARHSNIIRSPAELRS
jgi:hypothetical protein